MARVNSVSISGRRLDLAASLAIKAREVVAFTGGGGKTTAMFRLAFELASTGGRVLVTTTTHIFPHDSSEIPPPIMADTLPELLAAASDALAIHRLICVARGLNPDGRLAGIDPVWVAELRDQLPVRYILVEADGSKGRPFKAPAAHEPVIPAATNLVVAVVGLSIIGQTLSDEWVHRAEQVAFLTGLNIGDQVRADTVARVLLHPDGSRKGVPQDARLAVLLNQADDEERLEAAREITRRLMEADEGPKRVVIAALSPAGQPAGVREIFVKIRNERSCFSHPSAATARREGGAPAQLEGGKPELAAPVAAVVLAAGRSTRMGALKLGMRLGGKSLLRHVVDNALASPVDEVVVVLGHGADELRGELPADARVRAVYNPNFAQGQSSSLKTGINALAPHTQAAVILLGDQPLISSEAIAALIAAFRIQPAALVRAGYRQSQTQPPQAQAAGELASHPVLFSRALFPELLQIYGDQGGRELLALHQDELIVVNLNLEQPLDIDTMEEYFQMVKKFTGAAEKL